MNDRDKMLCRFVRFTPIMDEASNPGADCVQISAIQFFHKGSSEPIAAKAAESPRYPPDFGPMNAIDNSTQTCWTDLDKGPLVVEFKTAQTIDKYWWATSPMLEKQNCTPNRWKLEGRLDKHSEWTVIDERTGSCLRAAGHIHAYAHS